MPSFTNSIFWETDLPFLTCDDAQMIKRISDAETTFECTGLDNAVCNMYFDIDHKLTPDEVYDEKVDAILGEKGEQLVAFCIQQITDIEPKIAVATASKKDFYYYDRKTKSKSKEPMSKYSWRYFVPNIQMKKNEMLGFIIQMNKLVDYDSEHKQIWDYIEKDGKGLFDTGIYDNNRKMRCVNTSKIYENRPLILVDGSIEDTLITSKIHNSQVISFVSPTETKPKIQIPQSPTCSSNNKLQDIKDIIIEIRKHDIAFGYNYNEWAKIGWTIYNECNGGADGEILFDVLSQEFDDGHAIKKYDAQDAKKQYYTTQAKREKKLGLKWLCDKLKEHDPNNVIFLKLAEKHVKGKVRFATDDNIASDILFNELKDTFKSYKGRLFYLRENIWIADINAINDIMLQYILQSGIYYGICEKTGKPIPYAQNVSKALKIRDALYAKIRTENNDNELYINFHKTTKGKLCFNDGVLDLKTKQFHKWADIPKNTIFSTMKIDYDYFEYHSSPNKKTMNDIKTKLFEPMFGDKMDLALKFLARAMGGHCEDKRFATYLGNRNCGKGVLYDLLKFAFEDYVRTFELGNLLYCRKTAGLESVDCSKKLYWLIDLEFTRLAISQEVPDCKSGLVVNGGLFKKITGGGDDIVARRNYDRVDTHLKIDFTPFVLGNDDLQFDANDANETRLQFSSVVQFKTQEEIDAMKQDGRDELEMSRYRLDDNSIKDVVKTDEWKLAMIAIISQYYTDKKVPIIREIDVGENTLLNEIKSIFDFVYSDDKENDENVLPTKEVYSHLTGYANKKVKAELNAMNIFDKKIQKQNSKYNTKHCFVGIKLKPIAKIPTAEAVSYIN